MERKENYAFISYSSADKDAAFALWILLKNQKIPVWIAPYDIPAGSSYGQVINDALENCGCMVLLVSEAAQQSPFVERELERAVSYRKPIVPFWQAPIPLNSSFRFFLGSSQVETVPDIHRPNPHFGKLLHSIRLALGIPEPEVSVSGVPTEGIGLRLMEALEAEREWRFEELLWQEEDSAAIVVRSEYDSARRCVMQIRTLIRTLSRDDDPEQADAYQRERDILTQYMENVFHALEPLRHCNGILYPLSRQTRSWSGDTGMGEDMIFRFDWHIPLKDKLEGETSVPRDAVQMYGQTLAGALEQLHSLDIVHENVCMDSIYVNRYDGARLGIVGEMLPVRFDSSRFASGFRTEKDSGDAPATTDVTALGRVLAQLLGDRLDDRDALTGVVRKAAGMEPGEVYPDVAALRRALEDVTYKTPFLLQRSPAECGAAALSMVFSRLGVIHSLDQLCAQTNVSADGFTAGDMMRTAKRYGLECHGYRKPVEALRQMPLPCILHWNYYHFVVLEELREDGAMLNDPEFGHRIVSWETLEKSFTGVVLAITRA